MEPQELSVLKEWIDKVGSWDLRHFLVHNVSVAQATSVGAVFWPRLIEVDGCVFIEFLFDRGTYERWQSELNGDNEAIEKVINHLHLWDVFAPTSEADSAALNPLALKIAESWKIAAREKFPDRAIAVEVASEEEDYGPSLVLYSVRT